MQTLKEYQDYCKQLESEVGEWHRAYDAVCYERDELVRKLKALEAKCRTK